MSTFIMKPYCSLYYASPFVVILSTEISKRFVGHGTLVDWNAKERDCLLLASEIIRCDAIFARKGHSHFVSVSGSGLLSQRGDVFGWLTHTV